MKRNEKCNFDRNLFKIANWDVWCSQEREYVVPKASINMVITIRINDHYFAFFWLIESGKNKKRILQHHQSVLNFIVIYHLFERDNFEMFKRYIDRIRCCVCTFDRTRLRFIKWTSKIFDIRYSSVMSFFFLIYRNLYFVLVVRCCFGWRHLLYRSQFTRFDIFFYYFFVRFWFFVILGVTINVNGYRYLSKKNHYCLVFIDHHHHI